MESNKNCEDQDIETKLKLFEKDIENERTMSRKIIRLFRNELEEIIEDILILKEDQFISHIKSGVISELEETYSEDSLQNKKLNKIIDNSLEQIKKEYKENYDLLSKYTSRRNFSNDDEEIVYRKHCINNEEFPSHNCGRKPNKFIIVKNDNNKIKFLICSICKKVYYSSLILCRCYKCNVDYYTNILSNDEDPNLLPATWENYHCQQILSEKMKCIKCQEIFYLDMKTGMLRCINKKCGINLKPSRILWTCSICNTDFKSGCIPYNPLEIILIKKIIKQTLKLKQRAHPNKMPCCRLNVYFTSFYHKKNCNGILYAGEYNNNLIIVCEKCKSINFYNSFVWTCPKCGKKFLDSKTKKINNPNDNELLSDEDNDNKIFDSEEDSNSDKHVTPTGWKRKTNRGSTIDSKTKPLKRDKTAVDIKKKFQTINEDIGRSSKSSRNLIYVKKSVTDVPGANLNIENDDNDNLPSRFYRKLREKRKEKEEKLKEEEKIKKEEEEREKQRKEKKEQRDKEKKEKEDKRKEEEEKRKEEEEKLKEIEEKKKKENNAKRIYNYRNKYLSSRNNNTEENENENLTTENNENIKNPYSNRRKYWQGNYKTETDDSEKPKDEEKEPINNNNKYCRLGRLKNSNKEKNNGNNNNEKENKNVVKRVRFRRPESKMTHGKFLEKSSSNIKIDNDNKNDKYKNEDENDDEEENQNNNPVINAPTAINVTGIPDKLMSHLNKRIQFILDKYKLPIMNVEDYILYKKIGEGSYGVIFSVIDRKTEKQYALKKIVSHALKEIDTFIKEFELVHSCDHKNIMKIYGLCIRVLDTTTFALYVLMELANCDWDKEIKDKLTKRKNYSEKELINILYQITSALYFMQDKFHISHRDIKPQNILVFPNNTYKLADFGEAKEAKISKQINTLRGTELYMSPALYDGLKHQKDDVSHNPFLSDVFSLGFCFLYASALNFNLLYEVRDITDTKKISNVLHRCLQKIYSEKFISILAGMLEVDESKRLTFPKIAGILEENYRNEINY